MHLTSPHRFKNLEEPLRIVGEFIARFNGKWLTEPAWVPEPKPAPTPGELPSEDLAADSEIGGR